MTQNERDPKYAPHVAIDLRDQNSMFLALEELGIAQMQNVWLQKNQPQHEDAAAVREQAAEFMHDMIDILSGRADASRVIDNGWAGKAIADHLKVVLASEMKRLQPEIDPETLDTDGILQAALACYVNDLAILTERDQMEKMMGREVPAKEYIDFMIGWSGVFSGSAKSLELPQAFMMYKHVKMQHR